MYSIIYNLILLWSVSLVLLVSENRLDSCCTLTSCQTVFETLASCLVVNEKF